MGGGAGRGPGDDQGQLPPRALGGQPLADLAQGAAQHLLVQLGQLADGRAGPLGPEGGDHRLQGGQDPVRGLEEHHGPRLGGQLGQAAVALAGPAGQEPLEAEPVGGQAADHQRGQGGAGAGDHLDRHPALQAGGDQVVAGVGHGRHAGVADQGQAQPGGHPLGQLLGPLALADLVVAGHAGLDAQVGEQLAGLAGVLAGDQVGLGQGPGQPGRGVLEVADRGRADDQLAFLHTGKAT